MSEAPRLYQLQVLDLELDEKRRQVQEAEGKLGETPALQAARQQLGAARDRSDDLERHMRELEQGLEARSAEFADLQKRLFGGEIGKQKEASALERKLQAVRDERGRIEDELLEAMAELEELPATLAQAQGEAEQVEADWAAQQAGRRSELERLGSEVATMEVARRRLVEGLSSASQQIYEDLRRTHRGRAVARIERNTCQGCRVALPMGEVQHVRTNPALSFCGFCGRVLYLER